MLVLGIETSCDETGAAVVSHEGDVSSDVVHSQVAVHAPYGGIVPELASRDHLKNIRPVIEAALERAGVALGDLGGIAVTCRPGLSGALLVGIQTAQGLSFATGLPLVGVDHLLGHLLSVFLRYPDKPHLSPAFPFVGLLASGGHTAIYSVAGPELSDVTELGATRDDAAGEAFDKVAKLLGLGYPGGPVVDRLASEGDPTKISLSRPMRQKSSLEFSFSGLKTNVMRWVGEHGVPDDPQGLSDLCAAFQARVVNALVDKTLAAAARQSCRNIVVAGGVAANRGLRQEITRRAEELGMSVFIPTIRACTDNAAMIAYAGAQRLVRGQNDGMRIVMSPRTALEQVTQKGAGKRAGAA